MGGRKPLVFNGQRRLARLKILQEQDRNKRVIRGVEDLLTHRGLPYNVRVDARKLLAKAYEALREGVAKNILERTQVLEESLRDGSPPTFNVTHHRISLALKGAPSDTGPISHIGGETPGARTAIPTSYTTQPTAARSSTVDIWEAAAILGCQRKYLAQWHKYRLPAPVGYSATSLLWCRADLIRALKQAHTVDSIGLQLRRLREYRNVTQEALAERAGISAHHIWHVENGKRRMTLKTLERLAQQLGARVSISLIISPPVHGPAG